MPQSPRPRNKRVFELKSKIMRLQQLQTMKLQ